MQFFSMDIGRIPVVAASLVLITVLGGCAMDPEARQLGVAGAERVEFNTGRLVVVVNDQFGQPLTGARIDVDADEPQFYRNSSILDYRGSTSFSGVPQVVRVTVQHPNAYYSRPFVVDPVGTSEMRMIVYVDVPQ